MDPRICMKDETLSSRKMTCTKQQKHFITIRQVAKFGCHGNNAGFSAFARDAEYQRGSTDKQAPFQFLLVLLVVNFSAAPGEQHVGREGPNRSFLCCWVQIAKAGVSTLKSLVSQYDLNRIWNQLQIWFRRNQIWSWCDQGLRDLVTWLKADYIHLVGPCESALSEGLEYLKMAAAGLDSKTKIWVTCSVSTKLATCPSSFVPRTLNRVPARSELRREKMQALACLCPA